MALTDLRPRRFKIDCNLKEVSLGIAKINFSGGRQKRRCFFFFQSKNTTGKSRFLLIDISLASSFDERFYVVERARETE